MRNLALCLFIGTSVFESTLLLNDKAVLKHHEDNESDWLSASTIANLLPLSGSIQPRDVSNLEVSGCMKDHVGGIPRVTEFTSWREMFPAVVEWNSLIRH